MKQATQAMPVKPATLEVAVTQAQTRERLLEAAGQVFAEHGFRRATVREICARAAANVAAINYHFGDKMGLYSAVLSHWVGAALEKYPPDLGLAPDAPPEARLHAYVRSFLFRLLGQGAPAWHGQLMAREMMEPTAALDTLLATTIRPLSAKLHAIVHDVLAGSGADADDDTVRYCASSIAGQCCFYRHAQAMLTRLYPQHRADGEGIERLADHITRFSLAALRGYGGAARER